MKLAIVSNKKGLRNEVPFCCIELVGATGLEPAASWSRTRRATKLRYAPEFTVSNYTHSIKDCQLKNRSDIMLRIKSMEKQEKL